MIIITTGGRNYADQVAVHHAIDALNAKLHGTISLIRHGCAGGADALVDAWAGSHGIVRKPYPYLSQFGKAGGPMRNQLMVDAGADGVVAFPGGAGTVDLVSRAQRAGIKVWRPYG